MAKRAGCTFISIYDIVGSYIRVSVDEWCRQVGKEFDSKETIPVLETDHDASELIACLKEFGTFVNIEAADKFERVKTDWALTLGLLANPTIDMFRHQVRNSFYSFAVSWLIADRHYLCWERIAAALQIAGGIVAGIISEGIAHRLFQEKRIRDIVHVCAQFFETYVSKWLSENGGWEGIILLKDLLMSQQTQDIPEFRPMYDGFPGEYSVGSIINKDAQNKCLTDTEISAHEEMLGKLQGPHDTDINRQLTRHIFYSESDREQRNEDLATSLDHQSRKCNSESSRGIQYVNQRRRELEKQLRARQRSPTDLRQVKFMKR